MIRLVVIIFSSVIVVAPVSMRLAIIIIVVIVNFIGWWVIVIVNVVIICLTVIVLRVIVVAKMYDWVAITIWVDAIIVGYKFFQVIVIKVDALVYILFAHFVMNPIAYFIVDVNPFFAIPQVVVVISVFN